MLGEIDLTSTGAYAHHATNQHPKRMSMLRGGARHKSSRAIDYNFNAPSRPIPRVAPPPKKAYLSATGEPGRFSVPNKLGKQKLPPPVGGHHVHE